MQSVVLLLVICLSLGKAAPLEDFASGSRLFTGALYKELARSDNNNLLISPFSLETLLALVQSGALEETGAEIRSGLHLPETLEETESLVRSVLSTIHSNEYLVQTANKIYVEDNYPITPSFQKTATQVYKADFQNLDFAQNEEAAKEINQWVEQQTNNNIHDIVSPQDVDALTRIVLVNALYFQGNWTTPFQTPLEKKRFFAATEEGLDVDILFQESAPYNYAESVELDAQILELPFQGQDASMVLVLPKGRRGVANLENQIEKVLAEPQFSRQFVQVSLPKFRIDYSTDLKTVLLKLGVQKAFDPFQADFSGIAGKPGEIFLDKVVQKSFIEVNEFGVATAAATVASLPTMEAPPPPPSKFFIADHPFLFYIKIKNVILFEGKVLKPFH